MECVGNVIRFCSIFSVNRQSQVSAATDYFKVVALCYSQTARQFLKDAKMKGIERDFITLFNCICYQDFPVDIDNDLTNRAGWTIHIGVVIRQCANLLGTHAYFEQGGRTDAVLKYPNQTLLSNVEWEWVQSHNDKGNEIEKLLKARESAAFSNFVSYRTRKKLSDAIEKMSILWAKVSTPLIFFVVTFELAGLSRHFFKCGEHKKIRSQPTFSWQFERAQFNSAEKDGYIFC